MPTLFNGCGTSYAGKANPERHPGVCDACGYSGMLDQYDTRLCVTAIFIPLLPYRRMRILDECPRCKRHRAARLREYEMNRQLSVSAALADWRENPGVERAVAAHQVMKGFREEGLANRFMKELQDRFHQDARLKAYHGTMLLEAGRMDEARLQLQEALKLRTDLAEARIPLSRILMHDGDPAGALQLLEFMLHPGSSQLHNLGPLEHLANYLQANGSSKDAVRIYQHLIEELPSVAQVPAFRAAVQKAEAIAKRPASVLPPKKFSMHELLFGTRARQAKWAVFLLVAALLMVARNFWVAGHRTVHVVNAFAQPVSLSISPERTVTAPPGRSKFILAEGDYKIGVSGPVEEVIPVRLATKFRDRWSESPVWLLNPGGAAVLIDNSVTMGGGFVKDLKPTPKLLVSERFLTFEKVTHLFKDLPREVKLKRNQTITYRQLTEYEGPLSSAVEWLAEQDPVSALAAAHNGLRRNPGDMMLLNAIQPLLREPSLAERHAKFLQPFLDARPVSVEWHRAWQGTELTSARCTHLIAVYDSLLEKDPESPALMYLRGRVSPPGERESWYRRALEKEPDHTWAHFGMAWQHQARGEHAEALQHLEAALKKRPGDAGLTIMMAHCQAALRPAAVAQSFMLPRDGEEPQVSFTRITLAMALLGAEKKTDTALFARRNFVTSKSAQNIEGYLHAHALYAAGDFQEAARVAGAGGESMEPLRIACLLAGGEPTVAAELLPPREQIDPADALAAAVAFHLAGKREQEKKWAQAAIIALARGDSDEVFLSGLLSRESAPALADLQQAGTVPTTKALALALLALRFPEQVSTYAPLAGRFSAVLLPPMQLVRQAFAKATPP